MKKKIIFLAILAILFVQCAEKNELKLLTPHKEFIDYVTEENSSIYSVTKARKSKPENGFAIGVFDSGIGGLTVFDAIVNADFFNEKHENRPDRQKDFLHEQFVYLADQANMPYSNYVEEGKKDLLVEHVLKDVLFLLNNKYHISAGSPEVASDKPDVKAIVIACNTATAYAKPQADELSRVSGRGIKVIGVIDAGCKGALEVIEKEENATVAVFATPATVASGAYVNTLNEIKKGYTGSLRIIQQGGKGLAESIDNKSDYINRNYTKPYSEYQGPTLNDGKYPIEKQLLPYYNFDTTNHRILFNKNTLAMSDTIELNSVENYTRYHIVSLAEQVKKDKTGIPLKAIILGCTHYPYVSDDIHGVLRGLRKTERYSHVLADSVYLIDPALNTAKELYGYLAEQELFNDSQKERLNESRFFLSVPNTFEPDVEMGSDNRFTYEYQYKRREINELKDFTLIVPFSNELISEEQINRIQTRLPATYDLLKSHLRQ
ncbi:MAG: glutamate racemase [Bacteroidota bacterium]